MVEGVDSEEVQVSVERFIQVLLPSTEDLGSVCQLYQTLVLSTGGPGF